MNSIIIFTCLFALATIAPTTNAVKANPGQFPYHVGLSFNDGLAFTWCGGSLISPQWVLTAASCTADTNTVKVQVGDKVLTVRYDGFHTHPDFSYDTYANDIALLKIPTVELTSAVKPVALPSRTLSFDDEAVISSGWGFTRGPAPTSQNLQFGNFNLVSTSVCTRTLGSAEITSDKICAAPTNRDAACSGDYGSPLVLASSNVQVGIASVVARKGCGAGKPVAFTRVSSHLEWIKETTGLNV